MERIVVLFCLICCPLWAWSAPRILVVGDSLTEGYGVSKEAAFPKQVEILLKKDFPKVEVVNAGSSGSTSASAPNRMRWHLRKKPELVILALGANDGLRGQSTEAMKKNLKKAIDMAQKAEVKVVLAGMKIPLNYGKKYRADFEKVFVDLVKEEKIHSIPFLLKGVGGEPKLNLPDGIHPNEAGHKIIAKTVVDAIRGLL